MYQTLLAHTISLTTFSNNLYLLTPQIPLLPMDEYFSLIQWNANRIRSKLEFLNYLSETCRQVVCSQETFLKTGQNYNINGHQCFRKDREGQGKGGVATLVRD
jgi:hypothetical protein